MERLCLVLSSEDFITRKNYQALVIIALAPVIALSYFLGPTPITVSCQKMERIVKRKLLKDHKFIEMDNV